jgi:hypothetical protein
MVEFYTSNNYLSQLPEYLKLLESYIHSRVIHMEVDLNELKHDDYDMGGFIGAVYLFWLLVIEGKQGFSPQPELINHWRQVFTKYESKAISKVEPDIPPESIDAVKAVIEKIFYILVDLETGHPSNPRQLHYEGIVHLELFQHTKLGDFVKIHLIESLVASIQSYFFAYEKVLSSDYSRRLFDVLPAVEIIYLLSSYTKICPPPRRIIELWYEKLSKWAKNVVIAKERDKYLTTIDTAFNKLLKVSDHCHKK